MSKLVIKFRELPVGTIAFDENTTQSIKIPRVNAIRWLQLRFYVVCVEDNTANPTENEDTILNIIKKIRLVIDGDDFKINIDGRKAYYLEMMEKGTAPDTNKDSLLGQNATITYRVTLRIDFATNRLNESDISALLPARKYSKLDLEIDWGSKADLFTALATGVTTTDASSGVEVEMREVVDTDDKVNFAKGQQGNGFLDIRESTFSQDILNTNTNFDDDTLEIDIKPAPVTILKHLLQFVDTDDNLTNTASATDIMVQDTRGSGETLLKRDLVMFNTEMKTEYQLETLPVGTVLIDWIDKNNGGLQNTDTEGALKFKFKNGSPTGTPKIKGLTRYIHGRTLASKTDV